MRITISDHYGEEYSATISNDSTSEEVQEIFDRLMVLMGFANNIRCSDGGHYEITYVDEESGKFEEGME